MFKDSTWRMVFLDPSGSKGRICKGSFLFLPTNPLLRWEIAAGRRGWRWKRMLRGRRRSTWFWKTRRQMPPQRGGGFQEFAPCKFCAICGLSWIQLVSVGVVWFQFVSGGFSWFKWFGLVWFGLIWFDLVWFDLVWFGLVWFGLVWFGLVRFGLVWFGLVWFGLVWFGLVWFC